MNIQESGEMYLETIYILSKKMNYVRSIDVANYTGYSKPSVSRAVNLLKDNGYININDEGHITLEKSGLAVAANIYERHTILTKMLCKIGVSEDVASADACKMEHVISEETFNKVKEYFNK